MTLWFELIVTLQEPVPEHAPLQPENFEPLAGAAVSVTTVPEAKEAEQTPDAQSIPAGEETTLPPPLIVTVSVRLSGGASVNVAVTLAAAFIVTAQVLAPEHAPLQPLNW